MSWNKHPENFLFQLRKHGICGKMTIEDRISSLMLIRSVFGMPELSRFGGMVIYMLFCDIGQHNKPHVHVYYGEYEAAIAIDGELLAGSLPRKQLKIVTGWLAYHEEEAYRAWNLAVRGEHFEKIPPMN